MDDQMPPPPPPPPPTPNKQSNQQQKTKIAKKQTTTTHTTSTNTTNKQTTTTKQQISTKTDNPNNNNKSSPRSTYSTVLCFVLYVDCSPLFYFVVFFLLFSIYFLAVGETNQTWKEMVKRQAMLVGTRQKLTSASVK